LVVLFLPTQVPSYVIKVLLSFVTLIGFIARHINLLPVVIIVRLLLILVLIFYVRSHTLGLLPVASNLERLCMAACDWGAQLGDVCHLTLLVFFNILLIRQVGPSVTEEVVADVRTTRTCFCSNTTSSGLEWDLRALIWLMYDGANHLGMLVLRRELSLSLVLNDTGRDIVPLR